MSSFNSNKYYWSWLVGRLGLTERKPKDYYARKLETRNTFLINQREPAYWCGYKALISIRSVHQAKIGNRGLET